MILLTLLLASAAALAILVSPQRRKRWWPVALGLCSFLVLTSLNLMWPDFIPMGERLRDYAILAAVMHDPIAPQEPWFIGFPLNYYLNWYRLAALPGAVGFAPWEVYQIFGPATMAAGIAATAQLVVLWSGVSAWCAAVLSISLWLGSNVAGAIAVWHGDHSWWGPSRVITGAINEFPAWSWILGDLHPHYLNLCALPIMLLLLERVRAWACIATLLAWCAWNYSANAWDTAPALVVCALLIASDWRAIFTWNSWKEHRRWSIVALGFAVLFIVSALHIDAPHAPMRFVDWRTFVQPFVETIVGHLPVKIEPHVPGVAGSLLREFLLHWGFPFAVLAIGFLARLSTVSRALVVGISVIAVCVTQSAAVLLIMSAAAVFYFEGYRLTRSTALLMSMLFVLLVPELIFFDDPYGGENERMNTIFKFYSFAWIPFGFSVWCWSATALRTNARWAIAAIWLVLSLPWIIQTTGDRKQKDFILAPKAQGLSSFERTYPGSGKAIQVLEGLPRGTVVEAENGAYSDGAFVATLAGQPSFLGWANHVGLLLKNPPELGRRQQVVREIYEAPCEKKSEIMQREHIAYLVFGEIERRAYPNLSRASFECLMPAIEESSVAVYQRRS